MEGASLRRFEQELIENLDKKALIIDVRFNGGGGIDQQLLQILNQHWRYETSRARDSSDVPRPNEGFFGPMVVLQNERSASDAEMFPDGFRALGLGKVIGVPTYGAVIGTGEYELLDGSTHSHSGDRHLYCHRPEHGELRRAAGYVRRQHVRRIFSPGRDRQVEKAVESAEERNQIALHCALTAFERIFHPRRRRFHQAAELRLQLLHLALHLPGDLAIAEVAFHAAAQARDVFGFGEIHLEQEARPRARRAADSARPRRADAHMPRTSLSISRLVHIRESGFAKRLRRIVAEASGLSTPGGTAGSGDADADPDTLRCP